MSIQKLINVHSGVAIELNAIPPFTSPNWPEPTVVRRIVEARNCYEVYGTRGATSSQTLLLRVPYDSHLEVRI